MEPNNGDERLANNLAKCIESAREAYRKCSPTADSAVKDSLSYILGNLESTLEMIRPDLMTPDTGSNEPFYKRIFK